MGIQMGKEKGVHQMEEITLGNGKMGIIMVKELTPGLMGKSMKENGKMIKNTVKELGNIQMEESM